MPRPKKTTPQNYLDKLEAEVTSNQSRLSLILGALIVIVAGILIFNYFNKNKAEVGPAGQTEQTQMDVSPQNLPGKYTVKDGDTLFTIAEKYYQDGSKFTEIMKANNLTNENFVEVGQVLEIPKIETISAATPAASVAESPAPTEMPSPTPLPTPTAQMTTPLTGTTNWGPVITTATYVVQEGDWLSKIAARAYNGDILAYKKLAEVNKIPNPDLIFPGQVITIPR